MIKKIMAIFAVMIGFLCFHSCTYTLVPEGWGPHLDFRDELSRVLIKFGQEMTCKKQWILEDVQVKYNKEVHKIHILFRAQDIWELCEARKVLVETVDTLLERLNSEPLVLADHGGEEYTYLDLELRIKATSFVEMFIDPMYIAWFDLRNGVSSFYSGSFVAYETDPYTSWFKRREYFHQSRVIVAAQKEAEAEFCHEEEEKKTRYLESEIFRD